MSTMENLVKNNICYPELNDIDFLSKEDIEKLDKALSNMVIDSQIYTMIWAIDFKFSNEIIDKILNFLYENNIVSKHYSILCPECRTSIKIISEEYYNNGDNNKDWNDYYRSMYCHLCDKYANEHSTFHYRSIEGLPKEVIYKLCKRPTIVE